MWWQILWRLSHLIAVCFTLPETLGNCRAFQLLRGDVCSGAGEVAAEMVDVDDMIGPCERAVKKTDRRWVQMINFKRHFFAGPNANVDVILPNSIRNLADHICLLVKLPTPWVVGDDLNILETTWTLKTLFPESLCCVLQIHQNSCQWTRSIS